MYEKYNKLSSTNNFSLLSMENISHQWHYDYIQLAWDTGFTFKKNKAKDVFNKNLIAAVDVEKIIEEKDIAMVEKHINNLLQFSLDVSETRVLDPNFVKLFQLSQLAVEYLMYCKKYLDDTLVVLKYDHQKIYEENKELKKDITVFKMDKSKLKKEIKDLKSYVLMENSDNSEDLELGNDSKFQCSECNKIFISSKYLNIHFQKRHKIIDSNQISERHKLQLEIEELKQKLNKSEQYFNLPENEFDTKTKTETLTSKPNDNVEELRNQFDLLRKQVETELNLLKQEKTEEESKFINKTLRVADKSVETEDNILTINCSTQTDITLTKETIEIQNIISEKLDLRQEKLKTLSIQNIDSTLYDIPQQIETSTDINIETFGEKITEILNQEFQKLFQSFNEKVHDKFQGLNSRINTVHNKISTLNIECSQLSKINTDETKLNSEKSSKISLTDYKTEDTKSLIQPVTKSKLEDTDSFNQSITKPDEISFQESKTSDDNSFDFNEKPVFVKFANISSKRDTVLDDLQSQKMKLSHVISEVKEVIKARKMDHVTSDESDAEKIQHVAPTKKTGSEKGGKELKIKFKTRQPENTMYSKVNSSEESSSKSDSEISVKEKVVQVKSNKSSLFKDRSKPIGTNPSEIQYQFNKIVSDRLKDLGISPNETGVSNNIFQEKLKIVNLNRKLSMKKSQSFSAITEELLNEVEMKMKTSSSPTLNTVHTEKKATLTKRYNIKSFLGNIKNRIY